MVKFPIGTPDQCAEKIKSYIDAGARYLVLLPLVVPENLLEIAKLCISELIPLI